MAKGNGGTRQKYPGSNSGKVTSVAAFMASLGYAFNQEPLGRNGIQGELNAKGEIQLSEEQQALLQSALAKQGTGEELTQREGDAVFILLHEIGHYTAKERGLDSEGGVFQGSGIDTVSEVMNNIWADGHLTSFAEQHGLRLKKGFIPSSDGYRRLQGKLDRVMDILSIDKRAVYADIVADKVNYTGYHGLKGKSQNHQALAQLIANHSGGRISKDLAQSIIDNVAANSRDNEYQPKDRKYSSKKAAQIINDNKLAKGKVQDWMFIARSDFDNRDKMIGRKFTPTQIKRYYQF